jgi:cyclohexadienyl dehydratase
VERMRPWVWILILAWAGAAQAEPARFTTEQAQVGRILELADQRLAVMPAVAAVKWQTKGPIFDPPRETAVIQRAADLGTPMGLAGEPLKQFFAMQARLAREVQTSLHERWQAHGFSYSEPITTLAALRPKLDGLTLDILQAIYLAAPVLQRASFESDYAAAAQKKLQTSGWSDQNRRELLAVLHTVARTPVPSLQRIASSGLLRVGTTGDYAPFSLDVNDMLSGFDIDRAQKLAAQFHARPVFLHTTWGTLAEDLSHGAFDVVMGGVSITPAREALGAFSAPYAAGGKTILARCAVAPQFHSGLAAMDSPKVRVIVNPGGTNEQFVRANLHHARIVVFPDNRGIFDELAAGGADVMVTDDVEADLQAKNHPGSLCRAFPSTLTRADKAIFMPRDPELVKAVNDWLVPTIAADTVVR